VTIAIVIAWLSAVLSFSWGVLFYFRRSAQLTPRAGRVAILGAVCSLVHATAIATTAGPPAARAAGLVLIALATLLFWLAVRACGAMRLTTIFETDVPHRLIGHGPFRYVRHPFYASYTLFWIGGALASGSWLALAAAGLMVVIYVVAARGEERKFAVSALAGEYDAYRRTAGLMWPAIRWRVTDR
jgi:protein-S-isoprenylcysteine O-methyltransferase Ste14